MILDRPIIGIGPGHDAFNKIYPLYQLPALALSAYSIFLLKLLWKLASSELLSVAIGLPAARAGYSSSNCVDYEARRDFG